MIAVPTCTGTVLVDGDPRPCARKPRHAGPCADQCALDRVARLAFEEYEAELRRIGDPTPRKRTAVKRSNRRA